MITAYNLHNGKVLYKQGLILRAWPSDYSAPSIEIRDADELKSLELRDLPEYYSAALIDPHDSNPYSRGWRKVALQPGLSKHGTVWYWNEEVPSDINKALAPIFEEIDEDYWIRIKALNDRQNRRLIALHDFMKERM